MRFEEGKHSYKDPSGVDLIGRAYLSSPITPVCSIHDQVYPKCYYKINQGNTHLYVSAFVTCGGLGRVLLAKCKYYKGGVATAHTYWDVWSYEITYGKTLKTAYFQKTLAIITTIIIIISNMMLVLYMLVTERFLWVPFVLLLIVQSGELGK